MEGMYYQGKTRLKQGRDNTWTVPGQATNKGKAKDKTKARSVHHQDKTKIGKMTLTWLGPNQMGPGQGRAAMFNVL